MPEILLVEDERTIAMGVAYSLRQEGFGVALAYSLNDARRLLDRSYDLILLDLSLPDGNGYELCRKVRQTGDTPVIILTASDDEANVVYGLDLGADDYITKPFRLRELISRIRAVLRRKLPSGHDGRILRYRNIKLDTLNAKAYRDERQVALTALEYRLLLTLMLNSDRVLTRNQLLADIWDLSGDFVNDNTLTVYIKRLREKLEADPQRPRLIRTVRGVGYKVGE